MSVPPAIYVLNRLGITYVKYSTPGYLAFALGVLYKVSDEPRVLALLFLNRYRDLTSAHGAFLVTGRV